MKKKPLAIIIISIGYMLMPLFYYMYAVLFFGAPALGGQRVFASFSPSMIVLSVAGVIVGFSILQVRMWSWYVFLIHAGCIIIWNAYAAYLDPSRYGMVSLFFSAATLGMIGLFLLKTFREPYFNPRIRWWEQERRLKLIFSTVLCFAGADKKLNGATFDISSGGLFFQGSPDGVLGDVVNVEIDYEALKEYKLKGEIVWISHGEKRYPEGMGIKFIEINRGTRRRLRGELKKLIYSR